MIIQTEIINDVLVVKPLIKKLTSMDAGEFRESTQSHIDKGIFFILLDLSLIDYMDSSGLGSIASIHNYLEGQLSNIGMKGALGVIGLNDKTKSMFSIFRMNTVIPVFDNQEEAISKLKNS